MNVAYHSSNEFSPILGVSITSLFENNKDFEEINVFIIEKAINKINKEKLLKLAQSYGRNIYFIDMPEINETEKLNLVKVSSKWGFDGYIRIFLDIILPESIDRVLYLDSDVLVVDSLSKFYNMDLDGHCAAGIMDCLSEDYYDVLGFGAEARYCNSGVILYDLKKWREMNMRQAIHDYVDKHNGYVFFMEQTVLNGVMEGKWLIAEPRYNLLTMIMAFSYDEMQKVRKAKRYYSREEVEEAIAHPAIIHMTRAFTVNKRTWVVGSNHPALSYYEKYKCLSPWKDDPAFPDRRKFKDKFIYFWVKHIPRSFMLAMASFAYNKVRIIQIKHRQKKLCKSKT